jgi:hypothetical protein
VTWGMSPEGSEAFLRQVIRGGAGTGIESGLEWIEKGRYSETETEILNYWIEPGSTRMVGDSIYLSAAPGSSSSSTSTAIDSNTASTSIDTNPGSDLLARLALSCGLTRITKLGASEEQFEVYASVGMNFVFTLETLDAHALPLRLGCRRHC